MKQMFADKNFTQKTLDVIAQANVIIDEYWQQGFRLTLRQLYYQFVARDLIPNTQRSYKRLGTIVNDGRMCGLIDWQAIEDRTRNLQRNAHWRSPRHVIECARDGYLIDMWQNQPKRVEVWIEKEALSGVIEDVCNELDVPFFCCRGYVSQSEQWRAGVRAQRDQHTVILHFGDHDPSGIDMTRDNADRLDLFSFGNVTVERVALNRDQIDEYNPPPNPAKMTDSRFESYRWRYGSESWELDALEPRVINDLIQEHVERHRDPELWQDRADQLQGDLDQLQEIVDRLT